MSRRQTGRRGTITSMNATLPDDLIAARDAAALIPPSRGRETAISTIHRWVAGGALVGYRLRQAIVRQPVGRAGVVSAGGEREGQECGAGRATAGDS